MQVKDEPCATLSASHFQKFWVELNEGMIRAGRGAPGTNVLCSWQDLNPLPAMKFVGLTSWDTYNSYRNIAVHPCPTSADAQEQVNASDFWPAVETTCSN